MANLHDHGERRHAHLVEESTVVLPDILVGTCNSTVSSVSVLQPAHHLLVVWVEGLLNQGKLVGAQPPVGVYQLSKLKTPVMSQLKKVQAK